LSRTTRRRSRGVRSRRSRARAFLSRPSRKNKGRRNQSADGEGRQSKSCPRSAVEGTEAGRSRSKRGRGRRASVVAGGRGGGVKGKDFEFSGEGRNLKNTPRGLVGNERLPPQPATTPDAHKKPPHTHRSPRAP